MWQYNTNPNSDELYHHGILGQKWGKKSGPPYPLNASDHSAAERKAGWRKSIKDSSGNTHYESHRTKKYNKRVEKANKEKNDDLKNARELTNLAKAYEKSAKATGISLRKKHSYEKLANKAYEDAQYHKESANEWKEIRDYQNKKAKASANFDSKMQADVMARRNTVGQKFTDKLIFGTLGNQKLVAASRVSNKTDVQIYLRRFFLTGNSRVLENIIASKARNDYIKKEIGE